MPRDQRDTLEVLRFELYLVQSGAYRPPMSFFRDSPTCLKFGGPVPTPSCRECLLAEFIPGMAQNETEACSAIPLDEHGNSIASLNRRYNRTIVEEAVSCWLRQTVARLEGERCRELVACP